VNEDVLRAMTMLRGRPDQGILPSMTRRAFTLD
jgi:hypothetical protein